MPPCYKRTNLTWSSHASTKEDGSRRKKTAPTASECEALWINGEYFVVDAAHTSPAKQVQGPGTEDRGQLEQWQDSGVGTRRGGESPGREGLSRKPQIFCRSRHGAGIQSAQHSVFPFRVEHSHAEKERIIASEIGARKRESYNARKRLTQRPRHVDGRKKRKTKRATKLS